MVLLMSATCSKMSHSLMAACMGRAAWKRGEQLACQPPKHGCCPRKTSGSRNGQASKSFHALMQMFPCMFPCICNNCTAWGSSVFPPGAGTGAQMIWLHQPEYASLRHLCMHTSIQMNVRSKYSNQTHQCLLVSSNCLLQTVDELRQPDWHSTGPDSCSRVQQKLIIHV